MEVWVIVGDHKNSGIIQIDLFSLSPYPIPVASSHAPIASSHATPVASFHASTTLICQQFAGVPYTPAPWIP